MPRVLAFACACAAILVSAPVQAQDGGALYAQRCASCHEGGQVARAPARDVIAALTPDRIVAALETGTMRVQGESLTAEQRRTAVPRLIEYAGDGALDQDTQKWVFQALRDITGQSLPHDASAWRDWYRRSAR